MSQFHPRHLAALALISGVATLAALVAFADAYYVGTGTGF